MKKIIAALLTVALIISSLFALASCADPVDGKNGINGIDGKNGLDGKNGVDGKNGLDGKDGIDGEDGKDGLTPHIGENGNWWLGDTDTGVCATGPKGESGETGPAGKNGTNGENGTDGKGIVNPTFRYNVKTACIEASYDNGKNWYSFPKYPDDTDLIGTYKYPKNLVKKLPGTIASIDNVYIEASGYYGAVVSLNGIDYDTVTLTPSANYKEFSYAFLTELPTLGKVAPFCEGYYEPIIPGNRMPVTVSIPDDAKYLYVYYESKGVNYLPSSIVFSNSHK